MFEDVAQHRVEGSFNFVASSQCGGMEQITVTNCRLISLIPRLTGLSLGSLCEEFSKVIAHCKARSKR